MFVFAEKEKCHRQVSLCPGPSLIPCNTLWAAPGSSRRPIWKVRQFSGNFKQLLFSSLWPKDTCVKSKSLFFAKRQIGGYWKNRFWAAADPPITSNILFRSNNHRPHTFKKYDEWLSLVNSNKSERVQASILYACSYATEMEIRSTVFLVSRQCFK